MERLKIFTWHVNGAFLYYLSQGNFDIYVPINAQRTEGYIGRGTRFTFGHNVHELDADEVKDCRFDCVLFQSPKNYNYDQHQIFSSQQQRLPKIYVEQDPPNGHPTDTEHTVSGHKVTLVHVNDFNQLMWDNGGLKTVVIENGVSIPDVRYSGEIGRGVVVLNNLGVRGRRGGLDLFKEIRKYVPLDLVGLNSEELGGFGEVPHQELPEFIAGYRFFLNPVRYASIGTAVIEAMMMGMPVVGFATTEAATIFKNGVNGLVSPNIGQLIKGMKILLQDRSYADEIGEAGRRSAINRFDIKRFTSEWDNLFKQVIWNSDLVKNVIRI